MVSAPQQGPTQSITPDMLFKEPLINYAMPLRDLEWLGARRVSTLMALVLGNSSCVALLTCIYAGIK